MARREAFEKAPKRRDTGNKSYIKLKIFNKYIYAVADSGSNVTLLSKHILPESSLENLEEYNGNIVGAEGSPLKALGQISITITIADREVQIKDAIVIENLAESMLLGTTFFIDNSCVLNYSNLSFTLEETVVPLLTVQSKKETIEKAVLDRTIKLPPKSVINNISCKFKAKRGCNRKFSTFTGVFEPAEALLQRKYGVQSEDLLINVKKGKSHICIMNPNDYPVIMYRNQTLGAVRAISCKSVNLITNGVDDGLPSEDDTDNLDCDKILFEKLRLDDLTHLTPSELGQVKDLVRKYRRVFALDKYEVKPAKLPPLKIVLDTDKPIRAPLRPISLALRSQAEIEVKRLMDLDVIEHATEITPYHSPAFLIAKPGAKGENARYRVISDFRLVNKHIQKSVHALPDIESVTSLWKDCKYWSNLDLSLGYYQILLDEKSRDITTCSIPGVCRFRYKRVPLGLSCSSQHFQGVIEANLLGIKNSKCVQYLDDLATAAKSFRQMLQNLEEIFARISAVNLLLKPEKTRLFQKEIVFLGYKLSEKGLGMKVKKIDAILKMTRPRTKKQVKSFVSMAGFYRRFIKDFSLIAKPLTDLLKNNVRFRWGTEQDEAFEALRQKLTEEPILKFPDMDKQFVLKVDSSEYGTGAVLCQEGEDKFLHPVAYASRLLTPTQSRWSTFQREFYALKYYMCEKFRIFLQHSKHKTIVLTDHRPLVYWETSKLMDGPLWRWYTDLSQFSFTVQHIQGSRNDSDCPSRLPRTDDELYSNFEKTFHHDKKSDQAVNNNQGREDDSKEETISPNKEPNTVVSLVTDQEQGNSDFNTNKTDRTHSDQTTDTTNDDTQITTCNDQQKITANEEQSEPSSKLTKTEIQFTDRKTLIQAQKDDPVLSIVRKWVESGKKPPLSNKTQKLNTELKNYRASFSRLKLIDDVLYRTWEKENLETPDNLICVPEYYQETVIRLCHDIPSSGHFGNFKTLNRIRSRFYFPHCELMVKLYIDNCKTCILKSQKRKPVSPLQPFYGTAPNDIVQMDLLGPLPNNKHKYQFILVIVDKFTGWCEAVPLQQTTSPIIARTLLDWWISRNGLFSQIHSDRGPQFTSEVMKVVFDLLGMVYHSKTCAYRPMSDGGSEAMVKIVKQLLTSYCRENPETWPDLLQQVIFAYRTSKNTATGYSPMFLQTGRSAKLPMDLLFDTYNQDKFQTQGEYAHRLYKVLFKTYRFVEQHLKASRDYAKQYYDKRSNVKPFKVGDFVYLWRPKKKGSNTFTSNFYGPFEIVKQVTDYTYKIDVGNSRIHNIVPHDLLRLAPQGEFGFTRDYDPIDLEWDHSLTYQIPEDIPVERVEMEQPDRPLIEIEFDQGQPQQNLRRGERIRRPPDRFQAGF